jgi:hypothetical protein
LTVEKVLQLSSNGAHENALKSAFVNAAKCTIKCTKAVKLDELNETPVTANFPFPDKKVTMRCRVIPARCSGGMVGN